MDIFVDYISYNKTIEINNFIKYGKEEYIEKQLNKRFSVDKQYFNYFFIEQKENYFN